MKSCISLLFMVFALAHSASAQLYDAIVRPRVTWHELHSPHFRIIYHDDHDSTARATARILEASYEPVKALFGSAPRKMPVVLNGYNQLSNGYVTPFNYRIEVEIPPIRGKVMNPQSGSWLEVVMPHELVHAAHFSIMPRYSYAWFLGLLSPDFGRSVQSTMDSGMLEGLAVHYESHTYPNAGGRGNYAYFNNQFNANLTHKPWSLGQMLTPPGATRPGDRFYIGGYQLVDYLYDQHGQEAVKSALRGYSYFPFAGLAPYLWYQTKTSPWSLQNDFYRWYRLNESNRLAVIEEYGQSRFIQVEITRKKGASLSRPIWKNNDEVIFYGTFYNAMPGFYTYHHSSRRLSLLLETNHVEDFHFDYDRETASLLFSRYITHPRYDNVFETALFKMNTVSSELKQLADSRNLYAPSFGPDQLFALQTYKDGAEWVTLGPEGRKTKVRQRPDHIIQIEPNPAFSSMYAVIMNRNGVQGLWITYVKIEHDILSQVPDIAFPGASVFDASWSEDGMKLLFSSDYGGVFNIYEYDLELDRVLRLTNSRYNAMEGSYSPDMQRIAFISQDKNLRLLAFIEAEDFLNLEISTTVWKAGYIDRINRVRLGDGLLNESQHWESHPYKRNQRWLRPRAITPILNHSKSYGLMFSTADVLRQHAIDFTPGVQYGLPAYDISYRNASFYPGFILSSSLNNYRFNIAPNDIRASIVYDHSIGIPLQHRFDGNTRFQSVQFTPSFRYIFEHNYSETLNATLVRAETFRLRLFTAYYHKLAQPLRDAQPNRGWLVAGIYDHDLGYDLIYNTSLVNPRDVPPLRSFQLIGSRYLPVLPAYNQSLMVSGRFFTQNKRGYNLQDVLSYGFENFALLNTNNAYTLNTRYTIPIFHPDAGSFLIPWYMERIYLVLFSNTVSSFSPSDSFRPGETRSFYGAGIRFRNKFKFITYELGLGVSIEPTRNNIILMTDF